MARPGFKNNTSEHLEHLRTTPHTHTHTLVSNTRIFPFLIMNCVESFLKYAYLGRYRGTNKDLIANAALK